jgi:ribosomal protein L29
MKTTLEIPDSIFRRAKAKAAERGVPLRQFVSEAVAEKLRMKSSAQAEARMRLSGRLRHLRKETARINTLIEQEFERIEPEERD